MANSRSPSAVSQIHVPVLSYSHLRGKSFAKGLISNTVQQFTPAGGLVFFDPFGNVIDVEQGQSDGSVLETQNNSLIYYATTVNDVYAYFLTGVKNGGITSAPTQFPSTVSDLNKITTFAASHGKTFPDPSALAVELKSAGVEACGLPNPGSYIATYRYINSSNITRTARNSFSRSRSRER